MKYMPPVNEVVELLWEEVLPIWQNILWPGRKSEIKQHSSMQYLGGYDMLVYNNPVHFWGFKSESNEVLGVTSGFRSNKNLYRSRSIWLHPLMRGQNLTQQLFAKTEEIAKNENCIGLWSFPRPSVLRSYLRFGFVQTSKLITDFEFGPNCYVYKEL